MNKTRRKEIEKFRYQLEDLKPFLENIISEEQDYLDNIPENLQGSANYEKSEYSIGYLEEAMSDIDNCLSNLESIE